MSNGVQFKIWRIIEDSETGFVRRELAETAGMSVADATKIAEQLVKLGAIVRTTTTKGLLVHYSRKPALADGLQRDEWIDNAPHIGTRKLRMISREHALAEDGTRFVRVNLDAFGVDSEWRIVDEPARDDSEMIRQHVSEHGGESAIRRFGYNRVRDAMLTSIATVTDVKDGDDAIAAHIEMTRRENEPAFTAEVIGDIADGDMLRVAPMISNLRRVLAEMGHHDESRTAEFFALRAFTLSVAARFSDSATEQERFMKSAGFKIDRPMPCDLGIVIDDGDSENNGARLVLIARDHGWNGRADDGEREREDIFAVAERQLAGADDLSDDERDDLDMRYPIYAEQYLDENVAPAGYCFGWCNGVFFFQTCEWWQNETPNGRPDEMYF